MAIKVCIAGVTGWTGRCVAEAILKSDDLELSAGVARKSEGKSVREVLGTASVTEARIYADIGEALKNKTDVFVDFTSAEAVRNNVLSALSCGASVVIGSSGLNAADFEVIAQAANEKSAGVIACGNFSITAALVKHFSLLAAQFLPAWEVIDYASASKIDVPSGTVQELVEELATVRTNQLGRPLDELHGPIQARGAQIAGTPVHSVRLPGYVVSFESIFGMPNERLTLRHDAGNGAEPYVDGTLMAIRMVAGIKGVVRGLDKLLFQQKP